MDYSGPRATDCYTGYIQRPRKQRSLVPAVSDSGGDVRGVIRSRSEASNQAKANPQRTLLPSILRSSVRSLENKLDYLKLDLNVRREMRAAVFASTPITTGATTAGIGYNTLAVLQYNANASHCYAACK